MAKMVPSWFVEELDYTSPLEDNECWVKEGQNY